MCGRFTLRTPTKDVVEAFELAAIADLPLHYNIAPTQPVAVVRRDPGSGTRQLGLFRWGLVPGWADDPAIGNKLINARAETVATKPAFRQAFRKGRALVVADGFYEWKKTGRAKQPYYIRRADGKPFAFAGLTEHWRRGDEAIDSCTIITTDANELMSELHNRMPVILSPEDYELWLDNEFEGREKLESMLHPSPSDELTAYPVSTLVNSPANDGPQCIEPVQPNEPPQQRTLF